MVPEGWTSTQVGDLCSFINGHGFKSSEWSETGLPIIRIQNLNGSQAFNFYNGETKEQWIVNRNDILFAWAGTKGVSFGAKLWDGPRGVLNQHIFKITAKDDLHSGWLLLALLLVTRRVEEMAHGFKATLLHVQKSDILSQRVLVPPLPEQQKIAKILQTWDRAIATTEKLIDASKQQKKALMQQLLTGKKRFAGFEGEWKNVPLGSVGKILSGGTPDTTVNEYWNGSILWLTPTDVTSITDRFVTDTNRRVTAEGVKHSSATILPPGSLMVCTRATVGELAISKSNICTNQGFKNIVPHKSFNVEFVYYSLIHNYKQLLRVASGSTFLEVSKKDFSKIELAFPEAEEQNEIASALTKVDQVLAGLSKKLSNLKSEKKALMQQLLTGKRRVKVDEAA
jgi:type I restriction enzyme S subunit